MTSENETKNGVVTDQVFYGQCKWFNDRCGYGFISYSSGRDLQNPDKDIFVHYTNITAKDENAYKALQSGEYVQFKITKCETKEDVEEEVREQAVNVTGIFNGKLLNEYRSYVSGISDDKRTEHTENNSNGETNGGMKFMRPHARGSSHPRGSGPSRGRGGGQTMGGRPRGNFRGPPPQQRDTPQQEWTTPR